MNTRILMLMIICILMLILASASVDMSGTIPVYNVYTVYYYVSSILLCLYYVHIRLVQLLRSFKIFLAS